MSASPESALSLSDKELSELYWSRLKAYLESGAPELSAALGGEAGWLWRAMADSPFGAHFEYDRSGSVRARRFDPDGGQVHWRVSEDQWLDGMRALARASGHSEEQLTDGCLGFAAHLEAGGVRAQVRGQSVLGYPSQGLDVALNFSFSWDPAAFRALLEKEALEESIASSQRARNPAPWASL